MRKDNLDFKSKFMNIIRRFIIKVKISRIIHTWAKFSNDFFIVIQAR